MARGGNRRNYVRDANGRFASTPGGGSKSLAAARKAARPTSGRASTLGARTSLKKSRAKLAGRDPADQRLSTALSSRAQKAAVTRGNKGLKAAKVAARTRISGGKTAKTIKKVVNKKPQTLFDGFRPGKFKRLKTMQGVNYGKAAPKTVDSLVENQSKLKALTGSRVRPGEFYRGNFRPRNVTGKPVKNENPFGLKNQAQKTGNLDIALKWLQKKGYSDAAVFKQRSKKGGQAIARAVTFGGGTRTYKDLKTGEIKSEYYPKKTKIELNQYSQFWKNPAKNMREQRRQGWLSTSSPLGALWHEMGHAKDKKNTLPSWARPWNGQTQTTQTRDAAKKIAQRVSRYAAYSPGEFVAETYAGRRTGRKYDYQVMDAYREARGLPSLRLRTQKPLRRKPKS